VATRDPEVKRQLLLEAALVEFAEHGIAGARVDRIAARAGVSAGLVYTHFDGKDGLHRAVYDAIVEQAVELVPITPDDLPGYAGRLYDAALEHPEVTRFVTWYALERGDDSDVLPAVRHSMADKTAAVADAQRRGVVSDRMAAEELLATVLTLASMWERRGEGVGLLVDEPRRRAVVVETVARLVGP
jgi:AcrR family transcriptional regulator